MRYIKTFEKMNAMGYNPEEDKIYVFDYEGYGRGGYELIGKMVGYIIKGYILSDYKDDFRKQGDPDQRFVRSEAWIENIREATLEEINKYEYWENINKYNL